MNDDEIISQMELSPENGFKLLFDKYYNYTYTIVYHILHNNGSQMDIEECVSDVLSDVMVSYDTKHGDTLKAYIGTSARRRALYMSSLLSRKSARHTSIDDETSMNLPQRTMWKKMSQTPNLQGRYWIRSKNWAVPMRIYSFRSICLTEIPLRSQGF